MSCCGSCGGEDANKVKDEEISKEKSQESGQSKLHVQAQGDNQEKE